LVGDTMHTPFALPETAAWEGALKGVVVDQKDTPIPDAEILIDAATSPGGDTVWGGERTVYSGQDGSFSFCFPRGQDTNGDAFSPFPTGTMYKVMVEGPAGEEFMPYAGKILSTTEPAKIALQKGNLHRTFVFEGHDGPIEDPTELRRVRMHLSRPGQDKVFLDDKYWRAGGPIVSGTYHAEISSIHDLKFDPVEILPDGMKKDI